MSDSHLVRASRDGDQFHYLWAARRCLPLLSSHTGLVTVTIEGASSEENKDASQTASKHDEIIDVAEYFGSEQLEAAVPTRPFGSEKATSSSRTPLGRRENRSRSRLLTGVRRALPKFAVSANSMAQNTAVVEAALSTTVYRTPFFSELESDDRQECVVGRQTTRAQHCDDASCLCSLGRRIVGDRYRNDQEFDKPDASSQRVTRPTQHGTSRPSARRRRDFACSR
jgi:hypothetical protein